MSNEDRTKLQYSAKSGDMGFYAILAKGIAFTKSLTSTLTYTITPDLILTLKGARNNRICVSLAGHVTKNSFFL